MTLISTATLLNLLTYAAAATVVLVLCCWYMWAKPEKHQQPAYAYVNTNKDNPWYIRFFE